MDENGNRIVRSTKFKTSKKYQQDLLIFSPHLVDVINFYINTCRPILAAQHKPCQSNLQESKSQAVVVVNDDDMDENDEGGDDEDFVVETKDGSDESEHALFLTINGRRLLNFSLDFQTTMKEVTGQDINITQLRKIAATQARKTKNKAIMQRTAELSSHSLGTANSYYVADSIPLSVESTMEATRDQRKLFGLDQTPIDSSSSPHSSCSCHTHTHTTHPPPLPPIPVLSSSSIQALPPPLPPLPPLPPPLPPLPVPVSSQPLPLVASPKIAVSSNFGVAVSSNFGITQTNISSNVGITQTSITQNNAPQPLPMQSKGWTQEQDALILAYAATQQQGSIQWCDLIRRFAHVFPCKSKEGLRQRWRTLELRKKKHE